MEGPTQEMWWALRATIPRPFGCKPNALPTELSAREFSLVLVTKRGILSCLTSKNQSGYFVNSQQKNTHANCWKYKFNAPLNEQIVVRQAL